MNVRPVRPPPIVDPVPEGGNEPDNQDLPGTAAVLAEEVVEVEEANDNSSDEHIVEEDTGVDEGGSTGLRRLHLGRIPDADAGLSSPLSSQSSGNSQSRQLSDEELRQLRLQHFEKN